MTRILIDHGSGHNLGDTAMLEGVVRRLCTVRPSCELFVVDRPALRTDVWELPNVSPVKCRIRDPLADAALPWLRRRRLVWRWVPRMSRACGRWSLAWLGRLLDVGTLRVDSDGRRVSLLEWCEPFDALHVAGGGNVTDMFPEEVWQRTCLIHAFARQGKPVVLTGQQIGPFRSWLVAAGAARALRKAQFVGLREATESLRFCRRAGIGADRMAVMGDDSFGVAAEADGGRDLLLRRGFTPQEFVAVNVRIAAYASAHAAHLERIARLIAEVANTLRMPVLVVPIALNEADSDITSGYRLREAVGQRARVVVLDEPGITAPLAKGVLGWAFGAVGVSYHFCTFALSEGVPAVCIFDGAYYGQKARGLAQFWEDDRLALRLREQDAAAGEQIVATLRDDGLREAIGVRATEAHAAWQEAFLSVALSGHRSGSAVATPSRP